MRVLAISMLLAACGGEKKEPPPEEIDCDAVIAASPCFNALFARIDAVVASAEQTAVAAEATSNAAAKACQAIRESGVDPLTIRVLPPVCGETFSTYVECATAIDPSFDPSSASCWNETATLAGTCGPGANCTGSCVRTAPADCAGECYGVCSGTCDRATSRGVCLGTCTGACDGPCSEGSTDDCDGECIGTCAQDMDDPICVDGTWTTNDSCLGACDEPAVACSGTVVAFADAPGADTDADLAALLDALEPSLAARAFARALFDAWMAVIERESAALSAAMEGLAETDVVVTADLLSCLLERLPPSIDALQASVDALAARYATAASTYADACE